MSASSNIYGPLISWKLNFAEQIECGFKKNKGLCIMWCLIVVTVLDIPVTGPVGKCQTFGRTYSSSRSWTMLRPVPSTGTLQ